MRKRNGKHLELDVSTGWVKPSYFVLAILILTSFAYSATCNDTAVMGNLTMTDDYTATGSCLIVSAPDVTIDCDGYSVTGDGTGTGIYSDQNGTRVENCVINDFGNAINLDTGADYSSISNTSVVTDNNAGTDTDGILVNAPNITIDCSGLTLVGHYVAAPDHKAIYLANSNGSVVRNCIAANWSEALVNMLSSFDNQVYNNTERGIGYGVFLDQSSDNHIFNNSFTNNIDKGITLIASNGNQIHDNALNSNEMGVYMSDSCSNNRIYNNIISNNTNRNIVVASSNNNQVYNNAIDNAGAVSIFVVSSSNNSISNNSISTDMIGASAYDTAILLDVSAPENNFTNNIINAPSANGISTGSSDAGAFFINNTIISGEYCFYLMGDLDTYLGNNCTSDLWVSDSSELGNTFNDSTSGNIWNTANGTPASAFCDISGETWATTGTDLPFSSETACLMGTEYSCIGTPTACEAIETQTPCEAQYGCAWDEVCSTNMGGYYCGDEYTLTNETCSSQLGCSWAIPYRWIGASEDGHPYVGGNATPPTPPEGCDVLVGQTDMPYTATTPNQVICQSESVSIDGNDAVVLTAENITYDCQGYTVETTTAGNGIYTYNSSSTIRNCIINSIGSGIYLYRAVNGTVTNNTITSAGEAGVVLDRSQENNITDNTITATGERGVYITGSYGVNSFYNNVLRNLVNATNTGAMIELDVYSPSNTISDNVITGSGTGDLAGLRIGSGDRYSLFYNNTITTSGYCIDTMDYYDTYLLNNCTSNLWVHSTSSYAANTFSTSTYGNIWSLANGSMAKRFCDITDGTGNGFADAGTDLPFDNDTACLDINGTRTWDGYGADSHPYTGFNSASLEYCGGSNATAVTWIAYDLLTNALIPFNVSSNIQQVIGGTIQTGNFTGGGNATQNFSLCVNPEDGTAYAQLTDTITSPGYAPVQWYHFPGNYNANATTYKVYLLSMGNSSKLVQIFVVDNTYTPLLNVSVKIQQISPVTSENIVIGSFLVDAFGSTTQTLQPVSQLYHFSVLSSTGALLQDYSNRAIPCSSTELVCQLILVVNPSTLPIDITSLTGSCSYDSPTRIISCTGTDTSGNIAYLNVSAFGLGGGGAVCSNQIAGSSGTVTCTLPDINGTYNGYFFGIDTAGYNHLIDTGAYTVGAATPTSYGRDGFLALVMLVVIGATLMTSSIAISMTLGIFAMFAGLAFGIVPLNIAAVAIIFAIVAFVISYRLKV